MCRTIDVHGFDLRVLQKSERLHRVILDQNEGQFEEREKGRERERELDLKCNPAFKKISRYLKHKARIHKDQAFNKGA